MKNYLSLIKFSHTIFALPFAMVGFMLGYLDLGRTLSIKDLALVVLCMVFARSAAMAYNRLVDRDIDELNQRTASREIPAGKLSVNQVKFFVAFNVLAFVISAGLLNSLCLILSPVALLIILGYSHAKRYTASAHFILGIGLGIVPLAAYIACTGRFDYLPLILGLSILFWVSGFDIIYALQDEQFDKENGLHAIPARLGRINALKVSRLSHLLSAILIVLFALLLDSRHPDLKPYPIIASAFFVVALIYQQTLVKADDLSRVNLAFFTTNGIASLLYLVIMVAGLILSI